jgi:ketosteroid isomerase-like protein
VSDPGDDVPAAVDAIVSAFAEGRLGDYFAAFHPECTFVFYTADRRLESVQEYRRLWERWVREDGFEVVSCSTTDTRVQRWAQVAVVTHTVRTRVRSREGEQDLDERETIVLARQPDGRWLGVHEHLSPAPR